VGHCPLSSTLRYSLNLATLQFHIKNPEQHKFNLQLLGSEVSALTAVLIIPF